MRINWDFNHLSHLLGMTKRNSFRGEDLNGMNRKCKTQRIELVNDLPPAIIICYYWKINHKFI